MTARPAATVILLRDGRDEFELLMVQRTQQARFMSGHWVFPGGAVEPTDGEGVAGLRSAAIRELREEAGIVLTASSELVLFARWITPTGFPIRFDASFYLALAPADACPRVDGSEIVGWRWLTPASALAACERGELKLSFPTRAQLEQLRAFASADELLAHARAHADTINPTQPRAIGAGAHERIVLPNDPAFRRSV